jgi:hypothetical protein
MKKKAIIPVIILLILFIAVIWYTFPKEISIPGNNNEVVINFLDNGLGPLVYTGIANDQPHTHGYGAIFINSDLVK